jgi:hypothetical protein
MAASVMFLTIAALLIFFIERRIGEMDSRIVNTATDSHDLTLQQSSLITENIQTLRRTYADELAIVSSSINSLKQSIVSSEEQAIQREQDLKAQVKSIFAKVQKEVTFHHKAFDTQLNSLETKAVDRIGTLSLQQEKESAHIQKQLNKLALTLTLFEEDLQAINKAAEAQNVQKNTAQASVANRLHTVEKQLSLIHTILLQVKPGLPPTNQENTMD